ncbi:MAG TPA: OmpA family protein [Kofleriaceae bacterium]|nr:OmpA family protein [Kofleriaceae bacterium]
MRAVGSAAVGIFASIGALIGVPPGPARAEPAFEASVFTGVDRFGPHTELGNSFAPEQIPGTSALFGARFTYLVLPALPARLQLGVEAEASFAPATTGEDALDGRMSYFSPVFTWGGHVLLRYAGPQLQPHLVVGGGAASITSSSPFLAKETDGVVYWGLGVSAPVARDWRLRIDGRHDVMAARGSGLTSGFALQIGVSMAFGAREPAPRVPVIEAVAVAPPAPVEPVAPPPPPDPDGDGIVGDADKCPTQAEDKDGFEDEDGCPDLDNDHDGLADAADKCPNEAETRNGFDDDDGCPDAVPADVTAALATAVKFEPKRARVTPAAGAALKPLIAMLEAHPKLRLAIVGHPAGNDDLAKRRAEAIKWYLVDQGVIEDRIATSVRQPDKKDKQPVGFELAIEPAATK